MILHTHKAVPLERHTPSDTILPREGEPPAGPGPAGKPERVGVCSWSLQPADPAELVARVRRVGLKSIQCALDPVRSDPAVWGDVAERCADAGIGLASGMLGAVGEDYSTLDAIRRTGGLVPDATWPDNWRNFQAGAGLAKKMGLTLVTFHAGFLPHQSVGTADDRLTGRVRQLADVFADQGLALALETGQETAETLRGFLEQLNRPNVGVNFDPANMILYDQGDPVAALKLLGPWLRQCHIKDACRTRQPGTWGEEVPVGMGEVNWAGFFQTLEELQFRGHLMIEREAGNQRETDIESARRWVEGFLKGGTHD